MIRMERSVVVWSMVATVATIVRRLVVILIAGPHNLSPAFLLRDLGDLSPGHQRTLVNQSVGAILYRDLGLHLLGKLRAFRLDSLGTNLLCDVLTASSGNDLGLGALVLSAHLGGHLLAVLGRLGDVGALSPLHSLALGGHHVSADGIQDLLLHHHGNGNTHRPGNVLTLRD